MEKKKATKKGREPIDSMIDADLIYAFLQSIENDMM